MTHGENHSDTHQGHPNTGAETTPGTPDVPAAEMRHSLILDQQRGVSLGVLWKEGCQVGLGAQGAGLGAAAAISRACSLPDPLHLTHFLFFTHCLQTIGCQSDPQQNIYNYLPSPTPQHGPLQAAPSLTLHTRAISNSSVPKPALTPEVG